MTESNAGPVLADDPEWILRGAAPREDESTDEDDQDDDDQDDDTESADDQGDDADGADEDDDAEEEDDEDDDTDEVKSLKADLLTAQNRITSLREKVKARGAEIATLRAKVQQGKPGTAAKPKAKESTDQDADLDADKAAARIAQLEADLADQRVRSAFDGVTKYAWHNPDVAFGLIDLDDVRDSDGKVDRDALNDALADLAKDSPYLVKTIEKPKARTAKPARPTGTQPGAHKRDRSNSTDRKVLEQKFGALRGRS